MHTPTARETSPASLAIPAIDVHGHYGPYIRGESNSLPEDFVPWADRFPQARIILAHLGNSGAQGSAYDLQVRAIQRSRHGNLYVDTSSIKSMVPGLVEWAVREVGCSRVLFGTDTPLYCAAMQRARIDYADLSLAEKRLILRENAEQLLPLERLQAAGPRS